MTRNKVILGSVVATAIFAGGVLIGKSQVVTPSAPPAVTLGPNYPNLRAAQSGIVQAWNQATVVEREYPHNAQVIADINTAGRYLNQANDALVQAAKDEDGR
jgi:hypothetical protein